jgi:hypothetical protein
MLASDHNSRRVIVLQFSVTPVRQIAESACPTTPFFFGFVRRPVWGAGSTWSPPGEMKRAPLGARREMTNSPSHRPNRLEGYFQSDLHHALASRADERIAGGEVVRHARIAERAAPLELVPTIDEAG